MDDVRAKKAVTLMDAVEFWHEHLGQRIGAECAGDTKVSVPTRLKRGVDNNPLGAGIDAFYVVSEAQSYLFGKVELVSTEGLTFVPSEDGSGERFIAHWLAHEAPLSGAWMVGVIGKSSPNKSFTVSQPPSLCVFCQSDKSFEFNLRHFRDDVALCEGFDWRVLASAIYAYDDYLSGDSFRRAKGGRGLELAFKKEPKLKDLLPRLRSKPNSGEHTLLTWYNRAR